MESARIINSLKKLGLTEYEAKTYIALLEHGEADALEISRRSGVPRTRIYDILSKLESNGFIQGLKGSRPTIYIALPPSHTLKPLKDSIVKDLEDALSDLEQLYLRNSSSQRCNVWLFRGLRAYGTALRLIDEAKENVLVRVVYLPHDILENLWSKLRKVKADGIDVYLILDARILSTSMPKEMITKIVKEFNAKVLNSLIPLNGLVLDFKQALLLYASPTLPKNPFAFLIEDIGELGQLIKKHIMDLM
ncbi:MAG TPA: TrmB family transcriptional regulator [Nitrososphaeria archaeon]|nr:TrmB family transcriptional regulator [Nitrososphaeria archaeon]